MGLAKIECCDLDMKDAYTSKVTHCGLGLLVLKENNNIIFERKRIHYWQSKLQKKGGEMWFEIMKIMGWEIDTTWMVKSSRAPLWVSLLNFGAHVEGVHHPCINISIPQVLLLSHYYIEGIKKKDQIEAPF